MVLGAAVLVVFFLYFFFFGSSGSSMIAVHRGHGCRKHLSGYLLIMAFLIIFFADW